MSAFEIIDQVPEFAKLVALEIQRYMAPQDDEISTNAAYDQYGRAWVQRYTNLKQLNPVTRGNKRVYSRSEIERVRAKESAAARLMIKHR